MREFKKAVNISLWLLVFSINGNFPLNAQNEIPHLRKQGTATQLVVDGKPFLMLAGELRNSTCSNLEYMKGIWPRLARGNMNAVIATASWELVEPEEGKFDFTLVDAIIKESESANLKTILIWFASWKNSGSIYIPSWVKKDYQRFPRTLDPTGKPLEILSTFGEESMKADARAFAMMMRHIRETDKNRNVILVQVENEVGIRNAIRDFCPAAEKAFYGPVPREVINYLTENKTAMSPELYQVWKANGFKTSGNWEDVFGKSFVDTDSWKALSFYTEELFMAYHYARYIGYVAAEGKKEYNLPMYCNAWLKQPDYPWTGRFPGGGPLAEVMDMWKIAAPAIDFISPDVYYKDFQWVMEQYHRLDNPMFIPETRGGATGASNLLFAIGEYNIMGFSPFGVDGYPGPENNPLADTYSLLNEMSGLILQNQGVGTMLGILVNEEKPYQEFEMGDYVVMADPMKSRRPAGQQPDYDHGTPSSGGLIIQLGRDQFIVLGRDLNVRFKLKEPGELPYIGVDHVDEGVFKDGKWIPGRRLNGDETHCSTFSGTGLKMGGMSIQEITLYRYK
ncbi:MAG: DUF5597 domain-containing protein [Mangrovibacterium sp.]